MVEKRVEGVEEEEQEDKKAWKELRGKIKEAKWECWSKWIEEGKTYGIA